MICVMFDKKIGLEVLSDLDYLNQAIGTYELHFRLDDDQIDDYSFFLQKSKRMFPYTVWRIMTS